MWFLILQASKINLLESSFDEHFPVLFNYKYINSAFERIKFKNILTNWVYSVVTKLVESVSFEREINLTWETQTAISKSQWFESFDNLED